jgi:hypothetical protein
MQVLRVVIFRRISLLAMVEFASKEAATAAKASLHGCNIYPNMCTLRTEFTDKETLQVNENIVNERWDFTVSGPPSGLAPLMNMSPAGSLLGSTASPQTARKYLLDFPPPTTRPWKDKTESPDKIHLELSKFIIIFILYGTL